MKNLYLIILILWLPAVLLTASPDANFFYWRHQLIILTGILALTCMALAGIFAMRLRVIENHLHGLDKVYANHKILGIHALVLLIIPWILNESPKWLITLQWLTLPSGHHHSHTVSSGINWDHLAKEVGEYAFYAFLLFAAVSLIQRFTYRQFKFVHYLAGLLLIAGAFHGLVLMPKEWVSVTGDAAIVVLSMVALIAALTSLSGQIGRKNQVSGQVSTVHTEGNVACIGIELKHPIGYRSGQFAYLNFHDGEPPHPFSILHYEGHNVEFAIKALGDYTRQLVTRIKVGDKVTVEGGYGRFQIPDRNAQVWVGAGIGIAPFIAWLESLRTTSRPDINVHLFLCRHSAQSRDLCQRALQLCHALPQVNLHIVNSDIDGHLTAAQIEQYTDLSCSDVCFCGPESFGRSLKRDLMTMGLRNGRFHSEKFRMR